MINVGYVCDGVSCVSSFITTFHVIQPTIEIIIYHIQGKKHLFLNCIIIVPLLLLLCRQILALIDYKWHRLVCSKCIYSHIFCQYMQSQISTNYHNKIHFIHKNMCVLTYNKDAVLSIDLWPDLWKETMLRHL